MIGYLSVFDGLAEFHPVALVPEPAMLAVLLMGGFAILRRRKF
jgi:hypothetical protein